MQEILQRTSTPSPPMGCKEGDSFAWAAYEEAKWRILPRFICPRRNRKLLAEVPHMYWLDLAVVFYLLVGREAGTMTTLLLRQSHLEEWKVQTKDFQNLAFLNAAFLLPARCTAMGQVLKDLEGESRRRPQRGSREKESFPAFLDEEESLYVLTNPMRNLGAACIAYPGMLGRLGKLFGEDYYVLPSSIHEVLLVPASKSPGKEALGRMIREINGSQVRPQEVLGGHAYYYDRLEGKLRI